MHGSSITSLREFSITSTFRLKIAESLPACCCRQCSGSSRVERRHSLWSAPSSSCSGMPPPHYKTTDQSSHTPDRDIHPHLSAPPMPSTRQVSHVTAFSRDNISGTEHENFAKPPRPIARPSPLTQRVHWQLETSIQVSDTWSVQGLLIGRILRRFLSSCEYRVYDCDNLKPQQGQGRRILLGFNHVIRENRETERG